jgi:hypothetical protein
MAVKDCEHKRVLLAIAHFVDFNPDQEPFESGKIECAGVSCIQVGSINIHYCTQCGTVIDIQVEPGCHIDVTTCTIEKGE